MIKYNFILFLLDSEAWFRKCPPLWILSLIHTARSRPEKYGSVKFGLDFHSSCDCLSGFSRFVSNNCLPSPSKPRSKNTNTQISLACLEHPFYNIFISCCVIGAESVSSRGSLRWTTGSPWPRSVTGSSTPGSPHPGSLTPDLWRLPAA